MNKPFIHSVLNALPNEPQVLFKVNLHPYIDLKHKNMEVQKVYNSIITDIRYLLSRMSYREHRTYLLASYELDEKYSDNALCEFVCVMCSLTLNVKQYVYSLEFQTDSDIAKVVGALNYKRMLRAVYRNTMWENTVHDLEDSVTVDTDMVDHYSYFKNRLKDANLEDALIVIEDAIVE